MRFLVGCVFCCIQKMSLYELCLKWTSLVGLLSIFITMQRKEYAHVVSYCTACYCVLGYILSNNVLQAAVYWALYRHVVYCMLLCTGLCIVT